MLSTIWFDTTNGHCFAAHHDDGLVHPMFTKLAQKIAFSLAKNTTKKLRVVKYYALICSSDERGESAVSPAMMASEDSILALLWLTSSGEIYEREERGVGGGLVIFD